MNHKPTNLQQYLDRLEPPAKETINKLRALATRTAPQLAEQLKWGSPAYVHPDGVIMFILSAHRAHANIVFTPSTRESFDSELTSFETGKGSVKLPYPVEELSEALLGRMIRHRIREYEHDGVKWM